MAAGFVSLPLVIVGLQSVSNQTAFDLSWNSSTGRYCQVEYSPDLLHWQGSPGFVQATNGGTVSWVDSGPPATLIAPSNAPTRFYRVYQLGPQ